MALWRKNDGQLCYKTKANGAHITFQIEDRLQQEFELEIEAGTLEAPEIGGRNKGARDPGKRLSQARVANYRRAGLFYTDLTGASDSGADHSYPAGETIDSVSVFHAEIELIDWDGDDALVGVVRRPEGSSNSPNDEEIYLPDQFQIQLEDVGIEDFNPTAMVRLLESRRTGRAHFIAERRIPEQGERVYLLDGSVLRIEEWSEGAGLARFFLPDRGTIKPIQIGELIPSGHHLLPKIADYAGERLEWHVVEDLTPQELGPIEIANTARRIVEQNLSGDEFDLPALDQIRIGFQKILVMRDPAMSTPSPLTASNHNLLAGFESDFGLKFSDWHEISTHLETIQYPYNKHCTFKRNGEKRWLMEPVKELKRAQVRVNKVLCATGAYHNSACGFVPGRSHITHAAFHSGAHGAICVDIRNFFGSTTPPQILRALRRSQHFTRDGHVPNPFSGFPDDALWALTQLCTFDYQLPQGAPSSPAMANFVAYRLDAQMSQAARKGGFKYSRYADDMVFSTTQTRSIRAAHRALEAIDRRVKRSGWELNPDKTRIWFAESSKPLTICGLRVPGPNQRYLDLLREDKRRVRNMMHRIKDVELDELPFTNLDELSMIGYAYAATGNIAYRYAVSEHLQEQVAQLGVELGFEGDALHLFRQAWKRLERP